MIIKAVQVEILISTILVLVTNMLKAASTLHAIKTVVISSGIEPESKASEALILSVVLRDRKLLRENKQPGTCNQQPEIIFQMQRGWFQRSLQQ